MTRTIAALASSTALLAPLAGCWSPQHTRAEDRYRRGVVYVLPGIEGRSLWNWNIAVGLDEGGVDAAIEVYDWTIGVPGVYNLLDLDRNRKQAELLAARIVEHQQLHPGTPVHLVGHSAGGGVAVLVLEALPRNRPIDVAVLLAPALSPDYDLTEALRRTRRGIVNCYSRLDVGLLGAGTTVFGAVDRGLGPSAGAVGFRPPANLRPEGQRLYRERLREVEWTPRLWEYGASGEHFGWASRQFAAQFLAPLLNSGGIEPPLHEPAQPAPRPADVARGVQGAQPADGRPRGARSAAATP